MPMGFSRFRILNESGKNVNPVTYSAHSDAWGSETAEVIRQEHTSNIPTNGIFRFAIPNQPMGLPGITSVMVLELKRLAPNQVIEKWLLAPAWEGYEIREIQLDIALDRVTARLFLTEDYYEEHVRYFPA